MKKMVRAELTAFLSLIFLLLLSLVGAVIESASIQVMKNEKRADASRAIESVFAEYQRELFDKYHIFAIEGSYESGLFSKSDILNRLVYYGAENMDMEINKIRFLSDKSGFSFYEQAIQYEKEKTGVDKLENVLEMEEDWETNIIKYDTYVKDQDEMSDTLEQMLSTSDEKIPEENNPIQSITRLKTNSIWSVLLPEQFEVSDKKVQQEELLYKRNLQTGNWETEDVSGGAIFFNLYLMEHFGNALSPKEGTALTYELEYLIAGSCSDRENLETVLKNLCNFRFGINYIYLLGDSEKQAEARTLAASLCTLLTVPGITEVVTQGILLAWAYGESMVDVKTLISGGKVELIKTKRNWNLSLERLIKLEDGKVEKSQSDEQGLNYEKYLQMMLYMKNKKVLRERALEMIENNIRKKHSFFKADNCITNLRVHTACSLRRNASYTFNTEYCYQ